ncbi:DUF2997 domain-containing protein [Ectobacillus funiculus]|uniref:DUF2997 domain-containing protein n=1 Tax=Ectobacillus funiculus TaxID=137993 RepID=UPI00397A61BC
MEKRIRIAISPDGKIAAETLGIKGKDCLPYIKMLEDLLNAEATDSAYTQDYYENEIKTHQQINQKLRKE